MAVLSFNRFPTDRWRPNAALDGRTVAVCRLGAVDLNFRPAGGRGGADDRMAEVRKRMLTAAKV
ncbi:hypothetical protein [Methylorubrum extorquens]|uniref:hypothetical protein n=1 Tax=Methylorubrum extorquens TaxID=408 RepID=UPI002238E5CB|nr:hypothetical protein [Methylorubrum extorquens]UYW32149.1 hypothetical protein OKB92_24835 [Methylorubrum extorquens]